MVVACSLKVATGGIMERLEEGLFFRKVIIEGAYIAIEVAIANGDYPDQKFIIAHWPTYICATDWNGKNCWVQMSGFQDVDGNACSIDIKRVHPEIPMMTAKVTKYDNKSYDDAVFKDINSLIEGKKQSSVSWEIPLDPYTLFASSRKILATVPNLDLRPPQSVPAPLKKKHFSDKEGVEQINQENEEKRKF